MEDKKNLFIIIFVVFFVMIYLQVMFPQPAAKPAPDSSVTATQAANTLPAANTQNGVAPASSQIQTASNPVSSNNQAAPSQRQLEESPQTFINTGVALFTINHLGGRIQSVKLKTHTAKVNSDEPFELIAREEGVPLPLGILVEGTTDDFTLYQLESEGLPTMEGQYYVPGDAPATFTFKGQLPSGLTVTKKLTFTKNSYVISTNITFDRDASDAVPMVLQWTHPVTSQALTTEGTVRHLTHFTAENKIASVTFNAQTAPLTTDPLSHWVAMYDYYFIEAIINSGAPAVVRQGRSGDLFYMQSVGSISGGTFTTYSGPKDIETLRAIGFGLERSIDLGMFSFLAHPILSLIKFFHSFLGNYGLSIILLTLLIKLGFLPLTQSSFKSMKAMQNLQPEIAALRERVKDTNVLNQELMSLYKKRGVNPLGGCLPMLIQIPVFLGLYNALLNSIDLRHEPFALWINDLSTPEQLHIFGFGIPLMIILMGLSMFVQQLTQPSTMDPQQKKIMMFMPLIFTGMFIFHPMPSGLVLYWLTNNLISIVQQYAIREDRRMTPLQATAYASMAIFSFGFILTKL